MSGGLSHFYQAFNYNITDWIRESDQCLREPRVMFRVSRLRSLSMAQASPNVGGDDSSSGRLLWDCQLAVEQDSAYHEVLLGLCHLPPTMCMVSRQKL